MLNLFLKIHVCILSLQKSWKCFITGEYELIQMQMAQELEIENHSSATNSVIRGLYRIINRFQIHG
jgi:hypothetical protein